MDPATPTATRSPGLHGLHLDVRAAAAHRARSLLDELLAMGPGPYDLAAARTAWRTGSWLTRRHLRMLVEDGWLWRDRDGGYVAAPPQAVPVADADMDGWDTAARMHPGGYIGGWSALEHWGIDDGHPRGVLVLVPGRATARRVQAGALVIEARKAPSRASCGLLSLDGPAGPLQVSGAARTLADVLADPSLAGGISGVARAVARFTDGAVAAEELLACMRAAGNRSAFKRLGFLAEHLGIRGDLIDACRSHMSTGVSLLDPRAAGWGPEVARWGIRRNVPLAAIVPAAAGGAG